MSPGCLSSGTKGGTADCQSLLRQKEERGKRKEEKGKRKERKEEREERGKNEKKKRGKANMI